MDTTILLILLIITIAIAISQFGVILYFFYILKRNAIPEQIVKEAQEQSAKVILDAVETANEVVVSAEKDELKTVQESGKEIQSFAEQVKTSLESVAKRAEQELRETSKTAQKTLKEEAKDAEGILERFIAEDRWMLEQKTRQAIKESSLAFERAMHDIAEKAKAELEAEMRRVNEEVEEYKRERIAAVDAKILDIVQDVTLRVLGKTIRLDDHADLVYQSLQRAKSERAFF